MNTKQISTTPASSSKESGQNATRRSLALKLSLTAAIPILLITIIGIFLGVSKQKELSSTLVEREVAGIAASVREEYDEMGDHGKYSMDGDTLKKGNEVVSGNYEALDQLKEELDVELSLFYGDTRVITTLVDESGNREINTQMSPEIYAKIQAGETYYADDIELFGKPYSGYYVPVYQPDSNEIVGSVFCGRTQEQVNEHLKDTMYSMAGIMLIVFVVAIIIILSMVLRITRSLTSSINSLEQVADGHLKSDVKPEITNRSDEIGEIGRSIESLIHSLRGILTNITTSSETLESFSSNFSSSFDTILGAIDNVNTAVDEISGGATSQASETMTASQRVSEMGKALDETSSNVETLGNSSEKMKEYNIAATENLKELHEISRKTKESVVLVQGQTNLTNQSAQAIREATELISDIADQTNLLSLNASIEAARAGENGKGFAVVADEIRNLSEQSRQSTEKIVQIVNNLIENSDTSVRTMTEVTENIQIQNSKLDETENMFHSLNSEITEVAAAITQIREQTASLNEYKNSVMGIVDNLAAVAEENAASTEETSASMLDLHEIIQNCHQATNKLVTLAQELTESTKYFDF